MQRSVRNSIPAWASALVLGLAANGDVARAQDTRYDALWQRMRLYEGDADSIIRSVQFTGRLHVDQVYLDAGAEDHSETNLRRLRLGAKIEFLNDFVFHAEGEYDPQDGEPVYQRLTDAYVAWSPSDAVGLMIGKHGAPFTLDGMTSSKELLAIDRSNLTNNLWFTDEYIPGISVRGKLERWQYHFGVYSSGERNRGFGDSDGGEFWLGTVGYDLGARLGADRAVLAINVVANEPDARNTFTRPLEDVVSITLRLAQGRWGVGSDLSAAAGYLGQSDLQGFMVMPYYNLSDAVQLVARYTRVDSDAPNGVRFAAYERELESGRGDDYRELYLGMNYYWYGHKLKLQTGLQYADMNDRANDGGAYQGWSWTTGFRSSW